MRDSLLISGNSGSPEPTIEAGSRTSAPQRAGSCEPASRAVLDLWEAQRQTQKSPHIPARLPRPQHLLHRESQVPSSAALGLLQQFKTTLLPLSPNRRVAAFVGNREALYAMAVGLPNDVDSAHRFAELGLPSLVASVACDMLSTFESLCDRHGSDLLTASKGDSAWLVRVAASKGGKFARALLRRLPISQWHTLLAEDDDSGFRSLLRHKDSELLTTMFAATPDEQVKALLERSSHAVREAMYNASMAHALGPVLLRVNIHVL